MRKRHIITMAEMKKVIDNCYLNCPALSAYYRTENGNFEQDVLISRWNWKRCVYLPTIAKKACYYSISCANTIAYFTPPEAENKKFLKKIYDRISRRAHSCPAIGHTEDIALAKKVFFANDNYTFELYANGRCCASTDLDYYKHVPNPFKVVNGKPVDGIVCIRNASTGKPFAIIDPNEYQTYRLSISFEDYLPGTGISDYRFYGSFTFDSPIIAKWWQKQILTRATEGYKNKSYLTSDEWPLLPKYRFIPEQINIIPRPGGLAVHW